MAFTGRERRFIPCREVDYRALRLLTERSEGGSQLKRNMQLSRLDKAWRQGRLGYPEDEPTDWKWRMCEARMMLGTYDDWRGWEYRSEWAAGLWHNAGKIRYEENWKPVEQFPAWQGEKVDKLWVFGEQGLGDEICFGQVLEDVKPHVGEIIYETQPRLISVFSRCFGVTVKANKVKDGKRYFGETGGAWMALGDLLRYFRTDISQFKRKPYLSALPEQVERFWSFKGRVGISWRGAQGSYPLSEFLEVSRVHGTPLNLQYDTGWDEDVVSPPCDLRDDLEGILGLLSNLERVVTVSTTVAHFAAALGVKVDLILAPLNGIRKNLLPFKWWCEKTPGRSVWYGDNVRVFRNLEEYKSHLKA